MWSTEKTLQLIELLHSSPVLWDVTSEDYKNRMKKMDALREIATTFSVSEIDTEKKIKSLKVQFRREHLKLTSLKRSGTSPKKCAWFGYEPLLFLLQGQESRGSRSTDTPEREVSLCYYYYYYYYYYSIITVLKGGKQRYGIYVNMQFNLKPMHKRHLQPGLRHTV